MTEHRFAVHYFWGWDQDLETFWKAEHSINLDTEIPEIGINPMHIRRALGMAPGETISLYPITVKFPAAHSPVERMRIVIHRID